MKDKNEKKEKRARRWQQTKKLTRRIVIGKPKEPGKKMEAAKTKTLYLIEERRQKLIDRNQAAQMETENK